MLFVFDTCADWWRTLPALQHDDLRPEDIDTDGEDHAADETRYACASRPWQAAKPAEPEDIARQPTVKEVLDKHFARKRREREERR